MAYTETATEFFSRLAGDLNAFQAVGGILEFDIQGDAGGTWSVDLDRGQVLAGGAETLGKTPQAIIRAQERDFMALIEGRMSAQDGLLTERLHVAGDLTKLLLVIDTFEQLRNA